MNSFYNSICINHTDQTLTILSLEIQMPLEPAQQLIVQHLQAEVAQRLEMFQYCAEPSLDNTVKKYIQTQNQSKQNYRFCPTLVYIETGRAATPNTVMTIQNAALVTPVRTWKVGGFHDSWQNDGSLIRHHEFFMNIRLGQMRFYQTTSIISLFLDLFVKNSQLASIDKHILL